MKTNYDYQKAFSRNLGWLTELEQSKLKTYSVSIAGMGGVGGQYAEVLARLGICKFKLADFDTFEIQNFNRQNGSGVSTLDKPKIQVIKELILDINPEAEIEVFENGIDELNLDAFLFGSSLYLDGLDFFVLDIREKIFAKCREKLITAITVAPVGMGAALLVFKPESMSFAEYFCFDQAKNKEEKAVLFLIGLSPSLIQSKYLIDKTKSNFKEEKVPSLSVGPYLCAGVMGATVLKVLLKRGKIQSAPWSSHFDSYFNKYNKTYLFFGNRNPFQRIKFLIVKNILGIK